MNTIALPRWLLSGVLILLISAMVKAEGEYTDPLLKEGQIDMYSNYPAEELSMARTGRVILSFMIDEQGNTFEPMVELANNSKFIDAALRGIKEAKYKPATLNGKPVESWLRMPWWFDMGYNSPLSLCVN